MRNWKEYFTVIVGLYICCCYIVRSVRISADQSGCRDGTTEALQDRLHPKMAACKGAWTGHVRNSSGALCSAGWRVCSWRDGELLKTIRWSDAVKIKGCYAFNAAHDNSNCKPCLDDDVNQDNMAGVGMGCLRSFYGSRSCISGGRMEATCCRDSDFGAACKYRRGLTTGVLCCKMPGSPPRLISQPDSLVHATTGDTFVLSCLASGLPAPKITWLHDGVNVNHSRDRISRFDSGYLIISNSMETDDGWYQCLATNRLGSHASRPSRVIVRDHQSGCASGQTTGLFEYEDIHACKGRWQGHVRNGKVLCSRGWQVCSPAHSGLLKMITWFDVTSLLSGCYAYNAEVNPMGLCIPCVKGQVAGVGSSCGRKSISSRSCLAEGSISVLREFSSSKSRNLKSEKIYGEDQLGCHHSRLAGAVDGVLCCKKPPKKYRSRKWRAPRCSPSCRNGGLCVDHDTCLCTGGYVGKYCERPVCPGGCIDNAVCFKPRHCRCKKGFYGPDCTKFD